MDVRVVFELASGGQHFIQAKRSETAQSSWRSGRRRGSFIGGSLCRTGAETSDWPVSVGESLTLFLGSLPPSDAFGQSEFC